MRTIQIKAGTLVESYTEADGTRWVRVWRVIRPGLMQLVWMIAKPHKLKHHLELHKLKHHKLHS